MVKSLQLYVKPGIWRQFMSRKDGASFRSIANKVLARDDHTCQFCGFQAQEYQEVVNVDRNYRNNKLENLATACVFCTQCQFLESVGLDGNSGGQVVYLPEFDQAELNSFCHVLFCAMSNKTGYADTAQEIYRNFRLRCQVVEKKLGMGASNPASLGRLILEHKAKDPKMSQGFLKPLRLLPSYTKFKIHLETWAASAAKELEESKAA